jgi:uncharacterized phage protein gp47/JayE
MYENENYEDILDRMLSRIPESFDKRESSLLFNSSAPVAAELQNMYIAISNILDITYFDTAERGGKLERCKERGIDITQFDATAAVVTISVVPSSLNVPTGTRFNYDDLNFSITEKIADGTYYAVCEEAGSAGNVTGDITPVDYVSGLQSASITGIYQWGEDEADESQIDEVYYASLNSQAFGGNRADYIEKTKKIPGVGGVKVYSGAEWKGGGTVRLVITTSSYTVPDPAFVGSVQTVIDPLQNQGAGYGIAPIGHIVTVEGVIATTVDVGVSVTLQNGYTWADISDAVNAAIDGYFSELNTEWDDNASLIIRISQIETRLLNIAGVIDITGTTLNGTAANLTLNADSIAVRGAVTNA